MATAELVALPTERITYGPWDGSMRSKTADRVPRNYASGGTNYHFMPTPGHWIRRRGTSQKFDAFGAAVGMLPAKWGAKCRQLEEFSSESIGDGIPTVCSLLTRETVATGLDDGRFSTLWIRDQVQSINYTLGCEYGTTLYPAPGNVQAYKVVPLWYDSGDGGITRGIAEFQRRFFLSGSRSMLKVGNWRYFPSYLGTPSRSRDNFAPTSAGSSSSDQNALPISDSGSVGNWRVGNGGTSNLFQAVNDTAADLSPSSTEYVKLDYQYTNVLTFSLSNSLTNPGTLNATLYIDARSTSSNPDKQRFQITITCDGGTTIYDGFAVASLTGSFATYTTAITFTATPVDWTTLKLAVGPGTTFSMTDGEYQASRVLLVLTGTSAAQINRLIPSGPLPPIHAGTLAKGTQIENSSTFIRPIADITLGGWVPVNDATLYGALNDTTPNDTDYVNSTNDPDTFEVKLGPLGIAPAPDSTVRINYRVGNGVGARAWRVDLVKTATVVASQFADGGSSFANYTLTLTATQIADIGGTAADWADLRFRFTRDGPDNTVVSYVALEYVENAIARIEGGWRGSDKFYHAIAGRFEDDSIHIFCTPRAPNDINPDGFNLFTVDPSNPEAGYNKVVWSNIPILPYGYKSRILLRSQKINGATESILQLDPTDLRPVWEINDNTTTSYDDYYAADDTLDLESVLAGSVARDDLMMPPRARYIFGGDSRVGVSYGAPTPCAIQFAPVGIAADYDLNVPDTSAYAYGTTASYYRLTATSLELVKDAAGTVTTTTITFGSTYDTLEKLVDKINLTSFAVDGKQWRAQICPFASEQAACATALTPTSRELTTCVVTAQAITRSAGGLSKVAVGTFIADLAASGVTAGAYVSAIVSDIELTFVGTITAGAKASLTFVQGTGDAPTGHSQYEGYVRVIAGSLPGFLYFNKTYLATLGTQNSSVFLTVATPGSIKSAPNCFSSKQANIHTPPLKAGFSMGGAAVDNGFVVPFSEKNYSIRNTANTGSGRDEDYHLYELNGSRGAVAPCVTGGHRFAVLFTEDGVIACDLNNEMVLSGDTYVDAPVPTGDFAYEAPLCVAAAAQDTDTACVHMKIMGGVLWVNYRGSSASPTHPNRQVVYDFSAGQASNGLLALVQGPTDRNPGALWGWGLPLVRSVSEMCEARRNDGSHIYGWNDANVGSAGDGRIDELEIGDTDNVVAISASITFPWFTVGRNLLSAQEITVEHSSPTGATCFIDFHRSLSDETYTLTPTTSNSLIYSRDVKLLPLPARAATAACYLGWRQTVGGASELKLMELRVESLPSYK